MTGFLRILIFASALVDAAAGVWFVVAGKEHPMLSALATRAGASGSLPADGTYLALFIALACFLAVGLHVLIWRWLIGEREEAFSLINLYGGFAVLGGGLLFLAFGTGGAAARSGLPPAWVFLLADSLRGALLLAVANVVRFSPNTLSELRLPALSGGRTPARSRSSRPSLTSRSGRSRTDRRRGPSSGRERRERAPATAPGGGARAEDDRDDRGRGEERSSSRRRPRDRGSEGRPRSSRRRESPAASSAPSAVRRGDGPRGRAEAPSAERTRGDGPRGRAEAPSVERARGDGPRGRAEAPSVERARRDEGRSGRERGGTSGRRRSSARGGRGRRDALPLPPESAASSESPAARQAEERPAAAPDRRQERPSRERGAVEERRSERLASERSETESLQQGLVEGTSPSSSVRVLNPSGGAFEAGPRRKKGRYSITGALFRPRVKRVRQPLGGGSAGEWAWPPAPVPDESGEARKPSAESGEESGRESGGENGAAKSGDNGAAKGGASGAEKSGVQGEREES